jgi:glucosamine--fructose-6-phosphate aminotransferase (isomerizing)
MLKEIHEQPSAIKNTITPRIKNFLPDFSGDNVPDSLFKDINQITFVACGTAMHAGMIGKYVIESLARIPVQVEIASEFRYKNPIIKKEDLVVIISQSGETADSLAALRLAKEQGAKVLAVVNVVGSSIAREADYVIYTWAGPEIAVASTKAYSVQMSVIYLLAFKMALVRGTLSEDKVREYQKELLLVPERIEEILKDESEIKKSAEEISKSSSIFYIGRGLDYASAMEGSLKLKEISYIHSEAYASGELKHGTIALISEGTPVIALTTQNSLLEKSISNIKEVKCRGAFVIAIAGKNTLSENDVYDILITLPEISDVLAPMLSVVPLQLMAYYTAICKDCDVDKPRNLAKSVTVE